MSLTGTFMTLSCISDVFLGRAVSIGLRFAVYGSKSLERRVEEMDPIESISTVGASPRPIPS